jgi:solute carrier family 25 phosphate transporter 23/24/25/41
VVKYVQGNTLVAACQLTICFKALGIPVLTTLERARNVFAQPVLASFVAGGVAGAVSRTVVSPLERLKILFQVQSVGREEYKMSVPKALAKMWREEGWRGFMAGNGTNCIRIVPYSAVQFSAYNVYKRVSSFSQSGTLISANGFQRLNV